MSKLFLIIGAALGALGVILGAFGAHGLKRIADAATVDIYETAVRYQMYHAIALLITGMLMERYIGRSASYAGILFIAGIVLFSGSLYLISSLKAMHRAVPTSVGIITPIGGLLFILGWFSLLIGIIRK